MMKKALTALLLAVVSIQCVAHIPKGQFNSLVGGVKFYGKLRLNN